MAENLGKWPSKRGPISKIGPSDDCGRDAVSLAVERWYEFHGIGRHLANVGSDSKHEQLFRRCRLESCLDPSGCERIVVVSMVNERSAQWL